MKVNIKPPIIPSEERSPLVKHLSAFIEHQSAIIHQLVEENQLLKDEIARLKNQPPRPKIRPSSLEKKKKHKSKSLKAKRAGSEKRSKTAQIKIHNIKPIEPEHIPAGSEFRYYRDFMVQDIKFEPYNTLFRLKVYQTPGGGYVCGKLPEYLNGKHFGPTLISFVLDQYHHCHVTQPLLLEQLLEIGTDISAGQLNNLITEDKQAFHDEKDAILAAGLEVSSYINVDDTGARHKGQNGYCTHIGNELFAWFESTESKSRINFLKLLRATHCDYYLNIDAIAYMEANNLPQYALKPIISNLHAIFANDVQWNDFLVQNDILKERHIQIATEGALIGAIIEHGIANKLVIVSDDAGQFNVLLHALCWLHANRSIDKIIPFTDQAKKDLHTVKEQIWQLYEGLKTYKENPKAKAKQSLEAKFDEIFTTTIRLSCFWFLNAPIFLYIIISPSKHFGIM